MEMTVLTSYFLPSSFSSVTVCILGSMSEKTEKKDHSNSGSKVIFSLFNKLVYYFFFFFSTSELGFRPRSVRNICLSHASNVIVAES